MIRDDHVIVCIPYYRCQQYIRRAVVSILEQTHKNLTLVVVNDADFETPPWPVLADIVDRRLVRFDLRENKGPYFATQVVLESTEAPYLLIQDADDWSHPERVTKLMSIIKTEKSDFVISAHPQILKSKDGINQVHSIRWGKVRDERSSSNEMFTVSKKVTPRFEYRSAHHGLFKVDSVKRIGGYFGGFRISYDTLITNLILMTGSLSHTSAQLYFRFIREDSLTHSVETGCHTAYSRNVHKQIEEIYAKCYEAYENYLNGMLSSSELTYNIISVTSMWITAKDRLLIKNYVFSLKNRI